MHKLARYFVLFALIGIAVLPATSQEYRGSHPGYLHALSDLRAARWLLSHQPGDQRVYRDEDFAFHEIEAAIGEIKRASIDDGKNLEDHPPLDVREHGSRLLRAIEFLNKAQSDIDREEENPEARGLRRRASEHIAAATNAAQHAHEAWLREQGR